MFFVLSKTLGIVLLPINLLIYIGLLGVILLLTRYAKLGRRLMALSLLLLAIFGFTPIGSALLYGLESRFPPWDASRGAPDGIIVLGGSIDADLSEAHGSPVVHSSADRIIAAAALARRYPDARVVFTVGSPYLVRSDAREADYAGDLFESLGIPRSRLIVERRSRNTVENAEFSKALLNPKPGERWLLVTSAFHMPRAVALFRKAGFDVEAYPVDWRTGNAGHPLRFTSMAVEGLSRMETGMREWLGILAYHLTGKIDDWLPGPAER